MDQSTLSLIAAVGGAVAAIGGLFAAIAAMRSAGAARSAADHAQKVERRSLVRDVIAAAQNVIAEGQRVNELASALKRGYRDLFTFAGQTGGSRQKAYIEEVEKKEKQVVPLQQEAMELLEKRGSLRSMPEERLAEELTKLEGYVIQIRGIKEALTQELAAIEQQIQAFREKAIKGGV